MIVTLRVGIAAIALWIIVFARGLHPYVLYFKLLGSAGATNLLLVTLLIPVSAIFLGSLFLNETLRAVHFVGMALIALGLSVIDGRLWRRPNEC